MAKKEDKPKRGRPPSDGEKRVPMTVQARPSVMRQAKLACLTVGSGKFPEWLESAIVAAIPPIFQKGIGRVK